MLNPDVVFYSTSQIDELWIRSTVLEYCKMNSSVALLFGSAINHAEMRSIYGNKVIIGIHQRLLRFVKCRIIISASSGIPRKYMPAKRVYSIHMPHSLVSFHMAYPSGAFNGFDVIFSCGLHHHKEIEAFQKMDSTFTGISYLVGYGKSDLLSESLSSASDSTKLNGAPKKILIAPSWGKDNILESIGEGLIMALLKKNFIVYLRPHPVFFMNYNTALIERIRKKFDSNSRFSIENPHMGNDSLKHADIMISDYSGVAMEYAFSRLRPVIFVEVPIKQTNPEWQKFKLQPAELEIREKIGILSPPDVRNVLLAIEKLVKEQGNHDYESKILLLRDYYSVNHGEVAKLAVKRIGSFMDSYFKR